MADRQVTGKYFSGNTLGNVVLKEKNVQSKKFRVCTVLETHTIKMRNSIIRVETGSAEG